jgi:hypothetical protein
MKPALSIFALIAFSALVQAGEKPSQTLDAGNSTPRTLTIGPSSTSLTLGKAKLSIGQLKVRAGNCLGSYKLDVIPFSFKSENGSISIAASDAAFSKLAKGLPVSLTGKAITNGTGETRAVTATATPTTKDTGNVSFSFNVDSGKLVFIAAYRIDER